VQVGSNPDRVWAAGDDTLTFEHFLSDFSICARQTYERFAEGIKILDSTPSAAKTSVEKLAVRIGYEAVMRLVRLKQRKNAEKFVREAIAYREHLGVPPSAQRLEIILKEIEPRTKTTKAGSEVNRLRAEVESLRAEAMLVPSLQEENARLQQYRTEVETLRPLKLENDRLTREVDRLREENRLLQKPSGRRKAAA
jgi:hypothetical protein